MRVSTNMPLDNFLYQQQRLLASSLGDQTRLSTGRRVNAPSDDPVQAARILKLTSIEESQQQILENIRFAVDFLNASDASLTDVTDSLIRVQELASGAVSSIALPDERRAAALEVDSILQQLMSAANRQYLGLYVFGGRDVKVQPLVADLDGVRYVGDTGSLTSRLALDSVEEFNLTAHDVFGLLSERVEGSVDLNPALTPQTRLDELRGANDQGIRLGSLRFAEQGPAGTYTVDLTQATSIGQIIDLINAAAQAAGSSLTASINSTTNGIRIVPGDDVVISSLDNGVIASDLGIVTEAATGAAIEGADLNRLLTPTTPISDLLGGSGLDLADETFRIVNGSHSASITLGSARTVQDILNAINNAGIGARAVINETASGLDVFNEVSGSVMSIMEEGGTAAADLGILTLSAATLLADLNSGQGVGQLEGQDDLEIVAKDGSSFSVDLDTALTVQDAIDLINAAAQTAGVDIEASLSTTTNGVVITDMSGGAGVMQIRSLDFSNTAEDLGFDQPIDPAATEVTGADIGGVSVEGVFSALIALREALLAGSEQDITEAAGQVEEALSHMIQVQGLLGAQIRAVEARAQQTQQAVDATSVLLSQVRDLDYAEAISRFQQTQTTLQASLLASGRSLNLSLLEFLA